MAKTSPVAVFLAASALIASNALYSESYAWGDRKDDRGGLKEWTTDQEIDAESTLDKDAKKAAKKAKEEDICIPVGEGENCW